MLSFLWWFVAGPAAGWLFGRLMRSTHSAWMDALAGLIGAIFAGTVATLTGIVDSTAPLEAILVAAAGALIVTFILHKSLRGKAQIEARPGSGRSYTSYKSRLGK